MKLFIRWILLLLYITISLYGRDIPAYVTAWPKQVQVEKPDTVLGDKLIWEHWIYSERFAKRFEGFNLEKADSELQNSPIQAIVLRIYKENHWAGVNDNFPEQYGTDIDLYFDDTIQIPLSDKQRIYKKSDNYPEGIAESYKSLKTVNLNDQKKLQTAELVDFFLKQPVLIFAAPLDGRFSTFGNKYYPHLLEGISLITLQSRILGGVAVPLANDGSLWLSLFGARSYKNQVITHFLMAAGGLYNETTGNFIVDEHPKMHGFVRLPKTFTEVALPKITLIKDLNRCISARYSYKHPSVRNDKITKAYNELNQWCEDAERNGQIFDTSSYLFQEPRKDGLSNIGF